jgi:UDP-N-acetylglucosamine diphosphorylase/glucosamine-1-phosphate N-acetyltransferase
MPIPYVMYEDAAWQNFLPLVYTRAVFQLLCGTADLITKVQRLDAKAPAPDALMHTGSETVEAWCRPALADIVSQYTLLPVNQTRTEPTIFLNGRGAWKRLPKIRTDDGSWVGVTSNKSGIACIAADAKLAASLSPEILLDEGRLAALVAGLRRRDISDCVSLFDWPWQIVLANENLLLDDHRVGGWGGTIEGTVSEGSYLLARESIHIGAETRVKPGVVIDAEEGPVWIGRNVTIRPHCSIQGPAYIGDDCLLQPGTAIHAGSSIGPVCKIGGEIEASIIQGFSNKQHDGFLGHSFVGSWVNIAADCINSDLKNTYGPVRVPINGRDVDTGEILVGMLVGDYSKIGINVSIPTGAVIGFCSSVFAPKSPKFVPSFTWIDGDSVDLFDEQRGLTTACKAMARRNRIMTIPEQRAFLDVCSQSMEIEYAPQKQRASRAVLSLTRRYEAVPR